MGFNGNINFLLSFSFVVFFFSNLLFLFYLFFRIFPNGQAADDGRLIEGKKTFQGERKNNLKDMDKRQMSFTTGRLRKLKTHKIGAEKKKEKKKRGRGQLSNALTSPNTRGGSEVV